LFSRVVLWAAVIWLGFAAGRACCADAPASPDKSAAPVPEKAATDAPESKSESAAPEPAPQTGNEKDEKKKWIRGSFEAGFDGIWSDEARDLNLNQYLRLQVDPPQCPRLHVRGSLWLNEDLDSTGSRNTALRDITDASQADVRARLLYLYADVDDLWGDSTVRIGRQRIMEGPAFNRIDGVYFKQRYPRWDWYVFGGARATVYGDTHNDLVTGGGASVRLGDATRLALDTYYGEEHRPDGAAVYRGPVVELQDLKFPRRVKEDLSDTSMAFSIWQGVTQNLTLFARYDWRGGGDEILFNATGFVPSWDLTYELVYRRRLNALGDRVNDLTGFYRILGVLGPYDHYLVALHRPLTKKLVLSLEAELQDSQKHEWTAGNRDYQRYAAVLSAEGICKNFDARAALERWNVPGGEGTWAVTGEVTKHWKQVHLTLGADYQRYEDRVVIYDPVPRFLDQLRIALLPGAYEGYNPLVILFDQAVVETHDNIHSFYAKTRWRIDNDQDVTCRLTYEVDDEPESPYWRVQAEYGIRF
jgi:hypothetical protein